MQDLRQRIWSMMHAEATNPLEERLRDSTRKFIADRMLYETVYGKGSSKKVLNRFFKRFYGVTLGLLAGTLWVPAAALAGTLVIGCTGTVPRPPFAEPQTISFGTVLPGEAPVDSTFTIHNASSTTTWTIRISLPEPLPPGCAGFSLPSGGGPFTLDPNGQVEGTVRLDPNVPGSESRVCQVKVDYVLP